MRRMVHVLVIVLTLVVGATAAAIIVTQTAWFKNWLRGYIIQESQAYLNGQLSIERLGGNLFFGIEMENIAVSMDGTEVVAVEDLGLDYNVFSLVSSGMSIDDIRLNKPMVYLRRDGDAWSIARLIRKQEREADREGPASPVTIDHIAITGGSVVVDGVGTNGIDVPDRFDDIDAELSFTYEPVHYSVEIARVAFRGSDPAIGLNELSGKVSVRDDTVYLDGVALETEESSLRIDGSVEQYLSTPVVQLQVSSDKMSLPEIARVVPALAGVALQPAFEVKLNGPMDRLGVDMDINSSAGQITGQLTADVLGPRQSVVGDVTVRHLDLAPILKDPARKTDLTGKLSVDLEADEFTKVDSIRGSVTVDVPRLSASGYTAENVTARAQIADGRAAVDARASAYGAGVTARGRVSLPADGRPLSYDLRGSARHVDLRRLPSTLNLPRAATDVNASYHVTGTEPRDTAVVSGSTRTVGQTAGRTVRGLRSVRADVTFDDSTVAGARIGQGSTAGVVMTGRQLAYEADLITRGVDLQRLGLEFDVSALAADRFKSTIDAHVTAKGQGTDPKAMNVIASGTLTDSTFIGGRIPHMSFNAEVAADTVRVQAAGSFTDFDPSVAWPAAPSDASAPQLSDTSGTRTALQGSVTGTIDLDATIVDFSSGVTADSVSATARMTLDPSTVGGMAITRADVDADYRGRSADFRKLEIVGRDVNVSATGTLALNDTGQSNLTLHADTPSLEEIGKIVGRPLGGMAKVDATITGNRTELHARGTLVGSDVTYGANGALSLSSTFDARVPDLAFDRAMVDATTDATFVTVGGQNLNALTVTTKYAERRVDFDATAKQPERTLGAAGGLTLHPEHQEVHLDRLTLDTRGLQWQLQPGSQAALRYGGEAITVGDLTLVSGDQRISADGTFGRPGDRLQVTMTNVDLAGVDALMLRPPQLSGRLNASGTITGTRDEPHAEGQFDVAPGGFRQFTYDSLTGTVDYVGRAINVDARIQQTPTQWITAKGRLPAELFSSSSPAAAAAQIDLTIDSSPMDLGVIQGFTTALTDVTGTFEAHVHIAGTAADPQPTGEITVSDGAMLVEPTGVRYTNLAGRVDLLADRAHIDAVSLLDDEFNALSLSGDLAIGRRTLQAMQLYVTADNFKAIDNELGSVRIESSMEIGGTLAAPHVGGYLGVTTGEINLDEIVARVGQSAYSTEQIRYQTPADEAGEPAALGPMSALSMDVHLIVPDDLVVSASNLQTPGSPVGLGALTVTLGGNLRALKDSGGPFRLVGAVNTVRGNYDFQGRRFEILRDGTVRFVGLEEFNPVLDLRTSRVIQGVEARVNVRGTLRKPEIVLTSTPPLEQADILSLIVFNQPVNQLGEGQQISLAQRAQSIAAGAVAGQLAQSIGRALNLDTFEIQVAPETGDAARLTVGQQVGRNLYVKVQQGIGEHGMTNFILEYELTEWLRLQSNVVQGSSANPSIFRRAQGTGADLIFFFSY